MISPQVKVKNTNLSTVLSVAGGTIAVIVIPQAYKGPVGEANKQFITSEQDLYDIMGPPTFANYESWFSAKGYLKHGDTLWVSRAMPSGATYSYLDVPPSSGATSAGTSANALTVGSRGEGIDFDSVGSLTLPGHVSLRIYARGPGVYGNNAREIKVGVIPASVWQSKAPSASTPSGVPNYWEVEYGPSASDEYLVLVAIEDENGIEDIVEEWLVSTDSTKKNYRDESMYGPDLINLNSSYIAVSHTPGTTPGIVSGGTGTFWTLGGGTDGSTVPDSIITLCYDYYKNPEQMNIDVFIDGGKSDVVKRYITDICETYRKDSIAILDVPYANAVAGVESLLDWRENTLNINSSYAALYGNWGKLYDRYNDKYRWVPMAGFVAGIYAYNDNAADVWFAPAGFNRGLLDGFEDILLKPSRGEIDQLYQVGINPIVYGSGLSVWGQKTLASSVSLYNRVNIRRLYTMLDRVFKSFSNYLLFELNDRLLRSQVVSTFSTFLDEIKRRRGIADYVVICDENNNPSVAIDRNELRVDILIKPTQAVEYAIMHFVEIEDEEVFKSGGRDAGSQSPGVASPPVLPPGPTGAPPPPPGPPVPTLLSPASGTSAVSGNVNFTWQPSAGIQFGHIQVATDAGFAVVVVDTTGASAHTALLETSGTYYWHVRSYAISGVYSAYSPTWTYTVTAAPPPPTGVSGQLFIVDPDNGPGTTYTSMSACWAANNDRDLVTEDVYLTIKCKSTASGADTSNAVVSGHTTDLTHGITISADAAYRFPGWPVASGYRLTYNGSGHGMAIYSSNVKMHSIYVTEGGGVPPADHAMIFISGGADVEVTGCMVHSTQLAVRKDGIKAIGTQDVKIINNITSQIRGGGTLQGEASGVGVLVLDDIGTPCVYNNTSELCFVSYMVTGTSAVVKNNIGEYIGGYGPNFAGTYHADSSNNYAANDATAPGSASHQNQGTPGYVSASVFNYHLLKTDTKCIFFALNLSTDSRFPFHYDIDLDDRDDRLAWDIGADHVADIKTNYIIDPDNGPGTDYTTLITWESDAQHSLSASMHSVHVNCRTTSGTKDDFGVSSLIIYGWNCTSAYNITISGMSGYRAKAARTSASYTFTTTNTIGLNIREPYTVIDGINVDMNRSATTHALYFSSFGALRGGYGTVKNCFIRNIHATGRIDAGIEVQQGEGLYYFYNNIIASRNVSMGIELNCALPTSAVVFNNTIVSMSAAGQNAIKFAPGGLIYNECAVYACNNIISGFGAPYSGMQGWKAFPDFNMAYDNDTQYSGYNEQYINEFRVEFVDPENFDFRISRHDHWASRWGIPNASANPWYPGVISGSEYDIDGNTRRNHPAGLGNVNRDTPIHNYSGSGIGSTIGASNSPYIVSVIDPDGSGDYTTLAAWESDRQRNLVTAEEIEVALCRCTSDSALTGSLLLEGWTTNDNYYVYLCVDPAYRHNGVWDDTKVRIIVDDFFDINQESTMIEGFQVTITGSGIRGIRVGSDASGTIIRSNIVIDQTGMPDKRGIELNAYACVYNNILYGISGNASVGILTNAPASSSIIAHNLAYRCYNGYESDVASAGIYYNNIGVKCIGNSFVAPGDAYHGDSQNNLSDDNEGPTTGLVTGAVYFNDEPNLDLRLHRHVSGGPVGNPAYTSATNNIARLAAYDITTLSGCPIMVDMFGTPRWSNANDIGPHQCILQQVSIVDTGGTGDYSTIRLWEIFLSTSGKNLTTTNLCVIGELQATDGTRDTGNATIDNNWVSDPWRYMALSAHPLYRNNGVWDKTKYMITAAATDCLVIQEYHTKVIGIQAYTNSTATTTRAFDFYGMRHGFVDGCMGVHSAGGTSKQLFYFGNCHGAIITNCVASGISGSTYGAGFYFDTTGYFISCFNCLAYDCDAGFRLPMKTYSYMGHTYFVNCAAQGCTSGFVNFVFPPYAAGIPGHFRNLSEDNSAPGISAITGATIVFNDATSGDFRLSGSDTAALGKGVRLDNRTIFRYGTTFNNEIGGETRTLPWSIGPDNGP